MNICTFMCAVGAAISLAASAPACAAWTEGTAGRLLEQCHAFSELVQRNGRAKDSQELVDAGDCRKYIEGFFDGFTSERFKTGGRDHNQKICMPETGSETILYKDAIFYITSQIEGMPNTWGDSARSVMWVIVALGFSCDLINLQKKP